MSGKRIYNYKTFQKLYESGMGIRAIARLFGCERCAVSYVLRRQGVELGRNTPGLAIERELKAWLEKEGCKVVAQPRSAPFDLLVDGVRVDVKSAATCDETTYNFQLQDLKNRVEPKNLHEAVDEFYLVFVGKKGKPIYSLQSSKVKPYQTLIGVQKDFNTKHPIKFIGYLEGG